MKKLYILALALFSVFALHAQTPNWSQDIAPILYANCTNCHNPKGIAPFSLVNYADGYANSGTIKYAVSSGIMPPWPPDAAYRRLAHERLLSGSQIQAIVDWVNAGAPSGDTTQAPPKPVYSGISEIVSPDISARIPSYTVNTTKDTYRCFVIPSGLLTQKYITELEVIPGDRSIVHHVLVYEDSTNKPVQLDAADPGPGYTNFGGTGSNNSSLIGAWVPGSSVYRLPAGMGILLHANTNIILQIHYPGGTTNKVDSTRINLKLSSGPMRKVSISPILNHYFLDNGPLMIPANTVKTFTAHYTLPANGGDYSILSIGPHMHLIGSSISSWAVTPSNVTIPLISIPKWDFHWQGSYEFKTIQKLTAGTTLRSSATYDNTPSNPENPNDPPQLVTLGESTTDEMMLIYFAYTPYQPGDENIVLDSSILTSVIPQDMKEGGAALLDPYPNPFSNEVSIRFYLQQSQSVSLILCDLSGRIVSVVEEEKMCAEGLHTSAFDASGLAKGIYMLQMKTKEGVIIRRMVKV